MKEFRTYTSADFEDTYDYIKLSLEKLQKGEKVRDFKHYVFEEALADFASINGMTVPEFWDFFNELPDLYD